MQSTAQSATDSSPATLSISASYPTQKPLDSFPRTGKAQTDLATCPVSDAETVSAGCLNNVQETCPSATDD